MGTKKRDKNMKQPSDFCITLKEDGVTGPGQVEK